MANKVKTRFDSQNPNKGKVASLVGATKTDTVFVDLLEFKIEHNGVEMPLSKFLGLTHDKIDKLSELEKTLIGEVAILRDKVKLQQKILEVIDARLKKIEQEGNL